MRKTITPKIKKEHQLNAPFLFFCQNVLFLLTPLQKEHLFI